MVCEQEDCAGFLEREGRIFVDCEEIFPTGYAIPVSTELRSIRSNWR